MRQLLEADIAGRRRPSATELFEDAAALSMPLFAPAAAAAQRASAADSVFATLHGLYWLLNKLARERPWSCASMICNGPTWSRCDFSAIWPRVWMACRLRCSQRRALVRMSPRISRDYLRRRK